MADVPDIQPWERQPGEPIKAFHGFCHYRDLKVRSALLAWRQHKKDCEHVTVPESKREAPKRWAIWSAQWGWVDRSEANEADLRKKARERMIQAQVDAGERHARIAQAYLSAMVVPGRALLDAMRNPEFLKAITKKATGGTRGAMELLALLARMGQVAPGVALMERLALGMTTESVEVEDRRESSLAKLIATDPEAADLAIQLLHKHAGAGAGAPERSSVPRE